MQLTTFLLIEDNADHAALLAETFAEQRCANRIERVDCGEKALQLLHRQGQYAGQSRPDVVLLDLNLPGMSGLDVLREIKSALDLQSIPVIVLTTSAAERDRLQASELRADAYLVKPMNFEQLREVVAQLGLHWGILSSR